MKHVICVWLILAGAGAVCADSDPLTIRSGELAVTLPSDAGTPARRAVEAFVREARDRAGADSGDAAGYRCVVSSPYGSAISNEAILTLNTCPPITGLQNGDFENWPSGTPGRTREARRGRSGER